MQFLCRDSDVMESNRLSDVTVSLSKLHSCSYLVGAASDY